MTDLDMVLKAARNTKDRLEDFYRGTVMRAADGPAVAQGIGAWSVFIDELEMIQRDEMPK